MLKRVFIAVGFALCAVGPASAQSNTMGVNGPSVAAGPSATAAVATCENQMRRLAGLNKGLAANYNAAHVHDVCVANVNAGTDMASR